MSEYKPEREIVQYSAFSLKSGIIRFVVELIAAIKYNILL